MFQFVRLCAVTSVIRNDSGWEPWVVHFLFLPTLVASFWMLGAECWVMWCWELRGLCDMVLSSGWTRVHSLCLGRFWKKRRTNSRFTILTLSVVISFSSSISAMIRSCVVRWRFMYQKIRLGSDSQLRAISLPASVLFSGPYRWCCSLNLRLGCN